MNNNFSISALSAYLDSKKYKTLKDKLEAKLNAAEDAMAEADEKRNDATLSDSAWAEAEATFLTACDNYRHIEDRLDNVVAIMRLLRDLEEELNWFEQNN